MEPVFFSILGTPACGKSFFLAALIRELRRLLPLRFGLAFADADTVANRTLNDYEESLFLNPRARELVPLADLIRKTELQGELYDTVLYGNQTVSYPRPFMFTLQPQAHHPGYGAEPPAGCVLCLYDNAGEHFQAGQDTTGNPVTRHMAQARVLFFLFDPTQDLRFRQLCRRSNRDVSRLGGKLARQEAVLLEAGQRIRRVLGLPQNAKHNRPLIVIVTKHDMLWADQIQGRGAPEPWAEKGRLAGIDLDRVDQCSASIRQLLLKVRPEVVTVAENFASKVVYVPVSALGSAPTTEPQTGRAALRPADIRPNWVAVPLLYGLCRWLPGLIPAVKRVQKAGWFSKKATAPASARPQVDWFQK